MSYDAKTERLISIKKLSGKAQTSNDKGLANEALPSGITMASSTVFGEAVSSAPSTTSLYTITGKVEYVRFPATFIAGSDTSDGRHGFELKLPSDYESNSSNSKAGTYPFKNNQSINITSGALQLIPPSFSTTYEAKPFYGGSGTKDSGTQIPVLDARDWYMDYFNGIFFQQDPSGTGDQSDNPDYVEAFLYIGNMLDTVVSNAGSSGGQSFFTSPSNGFLNTTGSTAFAGSLGTNYAASSVGTDAFFFVSGSSSSKDTSKRGAAVFGGDVVISGTLFGGSPLKIGGDFEFNTGSASSTPALKNPSGSIKLFASNEVKIGSDIGRIRLIDLNGSTAGNIFVTGSTTNANRRLKFLTKGQMHFVGKNPNAFDPGTDVFLYVSGAMGSKNDVDRSVSLFGGDVVVSGTLYAEKQVIEVDEFATGSLLVSGTLIVSKSIQTFGPLTANLGTFTTGLSGSLTRLPSGLSYINGGSNITVTTASAGNITISTTAQSQSKKYVYFITSSHEPNAALDIPTVNFRSLSYDPDKVDIFVNGQLMSSGSSNDYILHSSTGSVQFKFELFSGDIISVRTY